MIFLWNIVIHPCMTSTAVGLNSRWSKAWVRNYIPLFYMGVITYLYLNADAVTVNTLRWRRDGDSNHQPHDCSLNHLFRCRSKQTSKLGVTDLWEGNSPVTGEFPEQRASNAETVFIWWRHHVSTGERFSKQSFYEHYVLIQIHLLWFLRVKLTISQQ